jgi:outer membrane lipoprotein carrier protein
MPVQRENHMNKFLKTLILLTLTAFTSVFSSEATQVLSKSAEYFNKAKNVSLDFTVKVHYEVTDETKNYTGDILIGQKDHFRLRIPGMLMMSDGVNLWQHNIDQKQVLVKSLLDMENSFHPSEMLFRYLRCQPLDIQKKTHNGKAVYLLKLDPKNQIKSMTAMEVWLLASDYSPVRLKTTDVSGNTSWYEISNMARDIKVSDSDYEFKTPAGVEEIDMR